MASSKKKIEEDVMVRKVKVHQDEEKSPEELTMEEKLNMKCDKAAGECVRRVERKDTVDEVHPGAGAMLWTMKGGVTGEPYRWVVQGKYRT